MSNLYNNEVIFNGQTLMSLKEDTVTPDKVLAGETFHDRSGAPQTGSLITHNVYNGLDSTSADDALSANMGKELKEGLDSANSNLTIRYKDVNLGTVTIGANGYTNISSFKPSNMPHFLFATLQGYNNSTLKEAFGITSDARFAFGKASDVITAFIVRYWYTNA